MRLTPGLLCLALLGAPAVRAEDPAPEPARKRFAVSIDRTRALSITSDELESFKTDGVRRLIFTHNVVVEQADVRIDTERLEAFYPKGANQPDRLIASGDVVVRQGGREARCAQATYHRAQQSLVCRGEAELRDGEDRVRGEVIELDLANETVVVTGGAAVLLHPRPEDLDVGEGPEG